MRCSLASAGSSHEGTVWVQPEGRRHFRGGVREDNAGGQPQTDTADLRQAPVAEMAVKR